MSCLACQMGVTTSGPTTGTDDLASTRVGFRWRFPRALCCFAMFEAEENDSSFIVMPPHTIPCPRTLPPYLTRMQVESHRSKPCQATAQRLTITRPRKTSTPRQTWVIEWVPTWLLCRCFMSFRSLCFVACLLICGYQRR